MKTILILLIIVPICFATCFREWFTTSTFPPDGWAVVTQGSGSGSWSWSDSGQSGNGYAHGSVNVGGLNNSADTTLKTFAFSLFAGDDCHVDFLIRGSSGGSFGSNWGWQVILYNGTSVVAATDLSAPDPWQNQSVTFQNIITASSNYNIGWKLYAACSPSGGYASATFDVDSVHIYDNSPAVASISVGRIKGAFH